MSCISPNSNREAGAEYAPTRVKKEPEAQSHGPGLFLVFLAVLGLAWRESLFPGLATKPELSPALTEMGLIDQMRGRPRF